jgi:DNA-binding transcriptional regulator YiaG
LPALKNGSKSGMPNARKESKPTNAEKRVAPVGKELVRRLGRFVDALESTNDLNVRFTCRTVTLNLQPKAYGADDVQNVRAMLSASQAIFAQFLGVSRGAVRDWEQGIKTPSGAACRLMDEIARSPEYFNLRLRELSSAVGAE